MDYHQFDTEDFINDPRFRNFVLQSNDKDYTFWSDFISRHPEKAESIQQAKAFLEFFYDKLPDSDLKYEFEKFEAIIQATKVSKVEYPIERVSKYQWLRIAAVFLLLCSTSIIFWQWFVANAPDRVDDNTNKESETALIRRQTIKGQKSVLTLSDGSTIYLNAETTIEYPPVFQKGLRQVYLKGEAFFDVQSDSLNPFVVVAENFSARATGTSFNIRSYSEDTHTVVSLMSGRLSVSNLETQKSISLMPRQKSICNRKTGNLQPEDMIADEMRGWREGLLILDKVNYECLKAELERWFDITIVTQKRPDIQTFNARFEKPSLESVMAGLAFSANFTYEIHHKTVIIK
ncbi:MAG: FecR domain-containing protein [Cyclobacteriaceae bacterium]|nr:FecR domain-containing protein [Cyclobacteriaceae bacterium]